MTKHIAELLIKWLGEKRAYKVADALYSYRDGDEGYTL